MTDVDPAPLLGLLAAQTETLGLRWHGPSRRSTGQRVPRGLPYRRPSRRGALAEVAGWTVAS